MKAYLELTFKKLDSGFLLKTEDEQHAINSPDRAIAKIRELMGISKPVKGKAKHEQTAPEKSNSSSIKITPQHPNKEEINKRELPPVADNQRYGILEPLTKNSKWPIKTVDFIVPELISVPNKTSVRYAETDDERILIEYYTGRNVGRVYTTWEEINDMVVKIEPGSELLYVKAGDFTSSQRTAIRQFMIAVRDGLKKGDSIELDPDKEFRAVLNRQSVIESELGRLDELD